MKFISKKSINYILSLDDTLLIKGFAICFILLHHLFTTLDYGEATYYLAYNGKVCLSLFILLSGYGLAMQFEKERVQAWPPRQILLFYGRRFLKLYLNYWAVFIIFVPLGIYVFGRTLAMAYGEENLVSWLFADIFGLALFKSYNITWWFYQLIVLLYIAFPLFYFAAQKLPLALLAAIFIILGFYDLPIENTFSSVQLYHRIFIIGIVLAVYRQAVTQLLNRLHYVWTGVIAAVIIASMSYWRYHSEYILTSKIDIVTSLGILILAIVVFREIRYLNQVFIFLGKHSMNIFMTHTFLYLYFGGTLIYSSPNPVIVFGALLISSLALSILLEFIKQQLGLYRLMDKIFARLQP